MSAEARAPTGPGEAWLRGAAYLLLVGLAILTPLALSETRPAFVSMSYGATFLPYELMGLTAGVAILAIGAVELRRRRGGDVAGRVAVLVPCLLALHVVTQNSEYAQRRFDYDCYEYAGRALLAGESPYRAGLIYLYPPLTAQGFAAAHTAVTWTSERVGASLERDAVWDRVFYLYQCAQVLLVVAAYFLLLRLGRDLGFVSRWAPVTIGVLLVFDNPVFRTLRHGQINLWVLNLALLGLVGARRRPALAGLAVALATHVKLYPILLLFPMLLCAHWRAAVWTVAFLAGVVVLGAEGGRDWTLWSQYLALVGADFGGEVAFRNNSLHSIAFNTATLVFGGRGDGAGVRWVVRLGTVAAGAWALQRLARREQIRRRALDPAGDRRTFAAHGADALAFALLASPSVWEHHYVMALPLALVALAWRGADRPGLVALGLFLTLAMPTFDLFPLGYHRVAGLLLLLGLTAPGRLEGGVEAAAAGASPVDQPSDPDPTVVRPAR